MAAHEFGTLVCIHGSGDSAEVWTPLLARLQGFQRLAIDLPGHGAHIDAPGPENMQVGDYAEAVRLQMKEREIAAAIVIGHSLGGAISLRLAMDYPDLVRGLILVGSGARLRVAPQFLEDARLANTNGSALMTELAFAPGHESQAHALQITRPPTAPGMLYRDLSACDRFDMMEEVSAISQPTLVVVGADDRLTPPKYAQFLTTRMPRCQLVIIPDAGHYAQIEQPDAVAQTIQEWVESTLEA